MNHQSNLFPVSLKTQWKHAADICVNDNLVNWLLDPNSLTARLKNHCNEFRVEVLGQKITQCSVDEANEDIAIGEDVLVREVLLFCDNKPHVFARSLLPLKSLTGKEKKLAELGDQPLGQVLFNNPNLIRKCIEVSSFNENSTIAPLVKSLSLNNTRLLWGRRSVFVLQSKPIMVAEVFLPDAIAYKDQNQITPVVSVKQKEK